MMRIKLRYFLYLILSFMIVSCGFHLRGSVKLPPALETLYVKTAQPYDLFIQNLKKYLRLSGVLVKDSKEEATTVLDILQVDSHQDLLGVSSTQLTRQYNLVLNVTYQITSPNGRVLIPPQMATETRALTIQSNQILGGSNEATNLDKQMRESIVFKILDRLSSPDITQQLTDALQHEATLDKTRATP